MLCKLHFTLPSQREFGPPVVQAVLLCLVLSLILSWGGSGSTGSIKCWRWICQSIKIDIDLSIDKSIKIGKSDLIDIDCADQSVEVDDTLASFIDLSRFYRFHRFLSEDTSVLLFIQKWKLISCKQWICWQLSCNWESKDQTINYHFF